MALSEILDVMVVDDNSPASTRATTLTQGTLMIDVWDAAENQLVWRGTVSDSVSGNAQRDADKIDRGIERAFRNFPPS